jgi:hypothetical protein
MGEQRGTLLYPEDVDQRLNWPLGRAARLARQRRLPYVLLPDGAIRFDWSEIEPLLVRVGSAGAQLAGAGLAGEGGGKCA